MKSTLLIIFYGCVTFCVAQPARLLVLQTDFGMKDGAVAAMKGVALGVDDDLRIFDLTHEIPAYNIWEGAYRLHQTAPYWPARTVFVSVVDPGVGSSRRSIVMLTKTGHLFVTPDNGTLTLVAETEGIEAVRVIDEKVNRLPGSSESYTFHGRDVYCYTAARLASAKISFEQVGPLLTGDIVRIPYQRSAISGSEIKGTIDVLDVQYGNVWTNIPQMMLEKLNIRYGDHLDVIITHKDSTVYQGKVYFGKTFADVPSGKPIAYMNSLMNFSLGINMGSFAKQYSVSSGSDWTIRLSKSK